MKKTFSRTNLIINDVLGRTYLNPLGEQAYRMAARKARLAPGGRILDVGCGRGYGAIFLAGLTGCAVTGIDSSPVMLADARRHAREARSPKLKFRNSLLASFRGTGIYDLVCCFDVLGFTPDRNESIGQLARLLKDGGTLCLSDYLCTRRTPASKKLIKLWNVKSCGDAKSLKAALEANSFSHIELKASTVRYKKHWEKMKARLVARKEKIIAAAGKNSYGNYLTAVESIVAATTEGSFGHITGFAVKKGKSGKDE